MKLFENKFAFTAEITKKALLFLWKISVRSVYSVVKVFCNYSG